MNKPNSIHQFDVFNKTEYIATGSICSPLQTISLKLLGGRVWLNTQNKEITLRSTNMKHHYLAIGKDKKEYLLIIHFLPYFLDL